MERQEVIDELKRVAGVLGQPRLAQTEFARDGRFSVSTVLNTFGSWNKAIEAAGLSPVVPGSQRKVLSDEELKGEFRRLMGILGRAPTIREFAAEAKYSEKPYLRRFGSWRKVVAYYVTAEVPTEALERRSTSSASPQSISRPTGLPAQGAYAGKAERRFGPPLDFRGLRHEPVNEQGVVFLFGMIAEELDFFVEAIQTGYPDCSAKRRHRDGYLVEAKIEFEFKSSHFREHGHDESKCDLIVCWEHNWLDCPLEVIELKSAIKGLRHA